MEGRFSMTAATAPSPSLDHTHHPARETSPPPRVWPAVVLIGFFWVVYGLLRWTEVGVALHIEGFLSFLVVIALTALVTLLFCIWWLASRRRLRAERLGIFGAVLLGGVLVVLLSHKSMQTVALLLLSLPYVLTAWTVGLVLSRRSSVGIRRRVLMTALGLSWGAFLLLRQDGLKGDGQADLHWRWTPTAEELYRAQEQGNTEEAAPRRSPVQKPLSLRTSDWPGFRGPQRDGVVHGVRIATDWNTAPPRLVWKRRVGPAWSSIAAVGEQLFTQEQSGDFEAVVCLNTADGSKLWVHKDRARHQDGQGGTGPRATPTFADGRLYALGATGILNCLDAATGERKWSHNLTTDAGAKVPLWGFSSSPLVVGGIVVVFAGGESEKTLLAYRADSGEPAWTASVGKSSHSSPQLSSIGGQEQILFLSDQQLTGIVPDSGTKLWEHGLPSSGPAMPRSIQPHAIGTTQVVFDSGPALGTMRIDITRAGGTWTSGQSWTSRQLKPTFNDFVVHDGAAYGFDGQVFSCIDLETGQRRWKEGRYGNGQVLLLADQALLLVVSEYGEVILVAANPARHEELGRFQAIQGKTWNHPVIAQGRLYVRNAEEMACYELPLAPGR
jgi:outer membrane protein assembly factor BamB